MKTICAPSQVIRDGSDLNQHGHAGRQEQASSNSPLTFQEVLFAVAAVAFDMFNPMNPQAMPMDTSDFFETIFFISFFPFVENLRLFRLNVTPPPEGSISKAPRFATGQECLRSGS
jgi:hypothetical protein